MPRYLIKVSHDAEHAACVRALDAIESYGSHLFTNADWGCRDGVHACWLVADLDDRNQAKLMIHPEFRDRARIVQLNKFSRDEIAEMVAELDKK